MHKLIAFVATLALLTAVPAFADTTAEKAAAAALISLKRSSGNTDVERPSCFIVQTYALCTWMMGGEEGAWESGLLHLKNGKWTSLGDFGEVTVNRAHERGWSLAAMFERQYGIPASVAKQLAGLPSAAPSAPAQEAIATGSAVAAVSHYYELRNAKSYGAMYEMFSPAYRAQHPYSAWLVQHQGTSSISVDAKPGASAADIQVVIHSVDRDAGTSLAFDLRGNVASDPRAQRVAPRQRVPAPDLIDLRKGSGSRTAAPSSRLPLPRERVCRRWQQLLSTSAFPGTSACTPCI